LPASTSACTAQGSAEARATSVLAGNVADDVDAITTMAQLAQAGKVRAIPPPARRVLYHPRRADPDEAGLPGYDASSAAE